MAVIDRMDTGKRQLNAMFVSAVALLYMDHKQRLGVRWHLSQGYEGTCYFSCFRRQDGPPGSGGEALDELLQLCDQYHITVELHAQNERLVPYYKRFGFDRVNPDDENEHFVFMRRKPYC